MDALRLAESFSELSTPLVSDAFLRLKRPFRVAPPDIRPLSAGMRIAGKVLPARHYGSVDIFLEAMQDAEPGDVLVIDNGGRKDEACIGDLTVLEARAWGLSGLVVWGRHRDSDELSRIGFPVFSEGACPTGPQRLDERDPDALKSAGFGTMRVSNQDVVFADDDGVIFASAADVGPMLDVARSISRTERRQAEAIRRGTKLSEQLKFRDFLKQRNAEPSLTFRKYLRGIGGEVEE